MRKQTVLISGILTCMMIVIVSLGFLAVSPSALQSVISIVKGQPSSAELLKIQQALATDTGKNLFKEQSNNLTQKVDLELVDLDNQIISCDPNVDALTSSGNIGGSCVGGDTKITNAKGKFLGGQCCGAMKNTKNYHKELKELQVYKNIPDIPLNPYKTPVELAKKWIDYDKATNLDTKEQEVFNQAISLSKEGPCCCKCWHYYVNEGIAKKLIKDHGFNSKQIANYWDVSSIC